MKQKEFDRAEAVRRRKAGENLTDIARDMGVSKSEVYAVIREAMLSGEWAATDAHVPDGKGKTETETAPREGAEAAPLPPKKRGRPKKSEGTASKPASKTAAEPVPEAPLPLGYVQEKPAPKEYFIQLKDCRTAIRVTGVVYVVDTGLFVKFYGMHRNKVLTVSAAEMIAYCEADCIGEGSGNRDIRIALREE